MKLAAACAVALLVVSGACGGSERYAGLTGDEAGDRVAAAVAEAQGAGVVAKEVGEAMAGSPEEAMGRAGNSDLRGAGPKVGPEREAVAHGAEPASGREAWVGAYGIVGVGSALTLCVYVWDGGSSVDVRPRC